MPEFEVELIGEAREVYVVEADNPEDAAAKWAADGRLAVSEASSMEVVSVRGGEGR